MPFKTKDLGFDELYGMSNGGLNVWEKVERGKQLAQGVISPDEMPNGSRDVSAAT